MRFKLLIWMLFPVTLLAQEKREVAKPNIVVILADDLGYGDVQCLNPKRGKIATPHMDQVAADGMTFTDAHTTSSVCTPTRYSLLTGRYNWRTKLQSFVLNGYGKPLIAEGRMTVPSFLKQHGYQTAMIGKWHLGLGLPTIDGTDAKAVGKDQLEVIMKEKKAMDPALISNIDWKGTITGGPLDVGFESWVGISASLDFPPFVWIKDRTFQAEGTHVRKWLRTGPTSEAFEAVDVLDRFAKESVDFIDEYQSEKPFFLYIPLTSPHTPILPSDAWVGKSGIGKYGDFVMQTDDFVGQVVKALKKKGISGNTLLIVTSDNGTSKQANFKHLEKNGHFAGAQYRGSKGDLWEGGHRVPFFVKWPKAIAAGSESNVLVNQVDLLATVAELVGEELPENAGEDSESILPILYGKEPNFTRKGMVSHAIWGHFAYRSGDYKLILASGSGGITSPKEDEAEKLGLPKAQLYNLADDPGEQKNLYTEKPEVAEKLLNLLKEEVENGRSTKGKKQKNDLPTNKIILWKGTRTR